MQKREGSEFLHDFGLDLLLFNLLVGLCTGLDNVEYCSYYKFGLSFLYSIF